MREGKKKLKGAIIGYGFIAANGHFPAYLRRDDVEITAIADICPERSLAAGNLLAQSKLHSRARVYHSGDELLALEKELDFVDIATPPYDHARLVTAALKQGVHVLCEKPLTTSLVEADQILQAAENYRRVVFPCHNYKHSPVVKTANKIIASGHIGVVHGLTLNTYRTTHAKGVKEWKTDWRREKKFSGGGIAMDHGSHTFYLTFNWLKSFPIAVTAKMTKISQDWDTEDNFSTMLTFPNGYATAHLSWTAGVRKVIYTIQGSLGAITINDDEVQVVSPHGTERFSIASHWNDASHVEWFNSMFDQFLECIQSGHYVNQELKEAYQCIRLITRAYESSTKSSLELKI